MRVFLAYLADLLAAFGLLAGMARFGKLGTPRKLVTAFLGVSGACGLGQTFFRALGYSPACFGNIWELAVLGLLLPALMMMMRAHLRQVFKPLQGMAVLVWLVVFLGAGDLPKPIGLASLGFYALLAAASFTVISQFVEDGHNAWKKPGFVIAFGCMVAAFSDVIMLVVKLRVMQDMATAHMSWDAFAIVNTHEASVLVWVTTARNFLWCVAYGLIGYSMTLEGRCNRVCMKDDPASGSHLKLFYDRAPLKGTGA